MEKYWQYREIITEERISLLTIKSNCIVKTMWKNDIGCDYCGNLQLKHKQNENVNKNIQVITVLHGTIYSRECSHQVRIHKKNQRRYFRIPPQIPQTSQDKTLSNYLKPYKSICKKFAAIKLELNSLNFRSCSNPHEQNRNDRIEDAHES